MVHYGAIELDVHNLRNRRSRSPAYAAFAAGLLAVACIATVLWTSRQDHKTVRVLEGVEGDEQLPFGWQVRYTAEGRKFYLDQLTGSTRFDPPENSTKLGYRYKLPSQWRKDPRLGVPSDVTILTNAQLHHYGVGGIGNTEYPFPTWQPTPLRPLPYMVAPTVAPTVYVPPTTLAPTAFSPPILQPPYMVPPGPQAFAVPPAVVQPPVSTVHVSNAGGSSAITIVSQAPPPNVVYLPQATTDPAAAPWGSTPQTAGAFMDYMRSPKILGYTFTPVNVTVPLPVIPASPQVDLITQQGPNDEAPLHIVGNVAGVSPLTWTGI